MNAIDISLYDPVTGIFTGKRKRVQDVATATPNGMGAWPGIVDPMRWRVVGDSLVERDPELPSLQSLSAAKWSLVKAERDAREFGGFTWDGSTFDSDRESQARIMGAVQMAVLASAAGQPFTIAWTLADNAVRTLSGADMVAVGLALGQHVATAHAVGRALREQIEAAQSAEDLATINWPEP